METTLVMTSSSSDTCATTNGEPCCGACDPVLELCNEDSDVCDCRPGLERCGDVCVDTSNNTDHCGMCDNGCNNNQNCGNGACMGNNQCPPMHQDCGNSCAALDDDPLHCGNCNTQCLATQSCVMGDCVD